MSEGGRALNAGWPHPGVLNAIKLRMPSKEKVGSQTVGDKVQGREGNSPDRQQRSRNTG